MVRFFVVLCCLFLCQAVALAATGTVRGTVTNGTKGGGSVEGLEVSLWTHATPGEKPIITAKVGKDGKFELTNVPLDDKGVYEVRVPYGEMVYASDPIVLTAQKPTATAEVTVYDPAADPSRLIVIMHHIRVLEVKNGLLHVGERMIVLNVADAAGGQAYVGERAEGGRHKVLRLSLPKGAQNVEVKEEHGMAMMGQKTHEVPLEIVEDGYVDMSPILPTPIEALHENSRGAVRTRTVAYSYDLKTEGGRYDLSRSMDYRTFTFAVLSKDPALNLKAPALKEVGDMDINGQTWKVRQLERVEPGARLEVTVAGRPFLSSEQGMAWTMAIVVFGACVIGVVIGTRVRKRSSDFSRSPRPAAPTKSAGKAAKRAARQASLEDERESLVDEIALLDERYEAGEISEEQYQRERTAKKDQLIELTKRLQKASL